MALAWALRNPGVTSVLVGASSAEQIRNNVAALGNPSFTEDELASIDQHAATAASTSGPPPARRAAATEPLTHIG